jgi:hypothetical protein
MGKANSLKAKLFNNFLFSEQMHMRMISRETYDHPLFGKIMFFMTIASLLLFLFTKWI